MRSNAWRYASAASATSALSGFDVGFSPRLRASAVNILFVAFAIDQMEALYAK